MFVLKNINFKYKNKIIFNKLNYEFNNNGLYQISGLNGIGKSTILNILSGMSRFDGSIILDNTEYNYNEYKKIANNYVLFHSDNLNLIENYTVYENLKLFLNIYCVTDLNVINLKIEQALDLFNITHLKHHLIKELSQGQRQVISIIRSFLLDFKIHIFDETISNLDSKTVNIFIKLIKKISEKALVIIVSHDLNILKSDRNYLLEIKDHTLHEVSKNDYLINENKYFNVRNNNFNFKLNKINNYKNFKYFYIIISILLVILTCITSGIYRTTTNNIYNDKYIVDNKYLNVSKDNFLIENLDNNKISNLGILKNNRIELLIDNTLKDEDIMIDDFLFMPYNNEPLSYGILNNEGVVISNKLLFDTIERYNININVIDFLNKNIRLDIDNKNIYTKITGITDIGYGVYFTDTFLNNYLTNNYYNIKELNNDLNYKLIEESKNDKYKLYVSKDTNYNLNEYLGGAAITGIMNNLEIPNVIYYENLDYDLINEINNFDSTYVIPYSNNIDLLEGEIPLKFKEVIVPSYLNINIGEYITSDNYLVVGIYDATTNNKNNLIGSLDTTIYSLSNIDNIIFDILDDNLINEFNLLTINEYINNSTIDINIIYLYILYSMLILVIIILFILFIRIKFNNNRNIYNYIYTYTSNKYIIFKKLFLDNFKDYFLYIVLTIFLSYLIYYLTTYYLFNSIIEVYILSIISIFLLLIYLLTIFIFINLTYNKDKVEINKNI